MLPKIQIGKISFTDFELSISYTGKGHTDWWNHKISIIFIKYYIHFLWMKK